MINEQDNVYRKHCNCLVELRGYINHHNRSLIRVWCVDHSKWLHTLTDQEVRLLNEQN
jgi:hypothetical protein